MSNQRSAKSRAMGEIVHKGQGLTIVMILLAVAGILVSAQLTHLHYKVNTDPDFMSFCNMGDAVNCESVAASAYSQVFGVPVAVWGMFAYAVLLGLALAGARAARAACYPGLPGLILLWSFAGIAATAALAYISSFLIASFCVLCMVLYFINTVVLVVALFLACRTARSVKEAVRQDLAAMRGWPRLTGALAFGLALVAVALLLFYPHVHLTSAAPLPVIVQEDGCGSNLRTAEGHPMIGAPDALVTIVEFSDYQCGHCRRAHATIRQLVDEFEGKVRFVHRHYPLDHECNPRIPASRVSQSCLAARAAICAEEQDKFWEMNDILFANPQHMQRKHITGYAQQLGLNLSQFERCLVNPKTEAKLREDIHAGIGWGVQGTPSFVINGQLVVGARPAEAFRQEIRNALAGCPDAKE